MKIYFSFIFLFISLCSFAGINHLLPKPQQIEANNELFHIDKIKLSTPVLDSPWEDFITEMGGTITDVADKEIQVVIVEDLPDVHLNKEEAYRLEER
ncbi:MAG TPA: beta-N-acetylhexosaminidase, partial [Dysgonomonas sp.]|nr:beta-N-acetylhexosaminidase [Dysgonomonas sp.]